MVEYIFEDYEKLITQNKKTKDKETAWQFFKSLDIQGKLVLLLMFSTGLVTIYFWLRFWFGGDESKMYGNYLFFSVLAFGASFYAVIRYADEKFENMLYVSAENYKTQRLNGVREIVKRFNFYTKDRIGILIQQCEAAIDVKNDELRLIKTVSQIFFLPLFFAAFQVWLDKNNENLIPVTLYLILLGAVIVGLAYILSPTWDYLKSKKVKRLQRLKRELQDILLTYF